VDPAKPPLDRRDEPDDIVLGCHIAMESRMLAAERCGDFDNVAARQVDGRNDIAIPMESLEQRPSDATGRSGDDDNTPRLFHRPIPCRDAFAAPPVAQLAANALRGGRAPLG